MRLHTPGYVVETTPKMNFASAQPTRSGDDLDSFWDFVPCWIEFFGGGVAGRGDGFVVEDERVEGDDFAVAVEDVEG